MPRFGYQDSSSANPTYAPPTIDSARYSHPLAQIGIGNGDSTVGLDNRPYSEVGKLNLNLLQPAQGTQEPGGTAGGLFTGLFGAVGGTFGEGGRQVGQSLGHLVEGGLGLVGGVPLPTFGAEHMFQGQQGPTILSDITEPFTQGRNITLGSVVQTGLGALGLLGRAVERTYAGTRATTDLPGDLQQLVGAGQITRDEALDRAVVRGQGYTNDPWQNMILSMALDPVTWASLGVGGIGKAAAGAEKVALASRFGEAAQGGEVTARMAAALRVTGHVTDADIAAAGLPKLGRLEKAMLNTVGRLPGFENTLVPIANQVARITEPTRIFSGGDIGKRGNEITGLSSTSGLISSYKPQVVEQLGKVLDSARNGARANLNKSLATLTSNYLNRIALDTMGADAVRAGEIPFVTGEGGIHLSPTEAGAELIRRDAFDASIGSRVKVMTERNKPDLVDLQPAEIAQQTLEKAAIIGRTDPGTVGALGLNANSYDMQALVHGAYYSDLATRLVDDVRPAIAHAENLPADVVPEQLTVIGSRHLSESRLPAIQAALDAENVGEAKRLINQYEDFDNIHVDAVSEAGSAEFMDYVQRWIDENRDSIPRDVPIRDAEGNIRPDFPPELQAWATEADRFGYGLALEAPPEAVSALWRSTRDAEGKVTSLTPWLSWTTEQAAFANPGRIQRLKMRMFGDIRTEQIASTNRRRFVRAMVLEHSVPIATSRQIFANIMKAAGEREITPRGLRPSELMDAVAKAVKNTPGAVKPTEKQVLNELLVAFRGDISQVGLTQAITGTLKVRAPGAASNFWGGLSERVYPAIKFTFNPWFMAQEYLEPYFLNAMRGIGVPLRRSEPGFNKALVQRNMVNTIARGDLSPDGAAAEMAEFTRMLSGAHQEAHQVLSGNILGRTYNAFAGGIWGGISERKAAAEGLLAKDIVGKRFREAVIQLKGEEAWTALEQEFLTTDAGEITFNWAAQAFHLNNSLGDRADAMIDLLNPQIGRSTRIFKGDGAGLRWHQLSTMLGRDDGEAGLLAALKDGTYSREQFAQDIGEGSSVNAPGSFVDYAYKMATGPELRDFYKGYGARYLGKEVAEARPAIQRAHRALIQARARTMGLSEEEFIKTKFAKPPIGVTDEEALAGANRLFEMGDRHATTIAEKTGKDTAAYTDFIDGQTAPVPESARASELGGHFLNEPSTAPVHALMNELPAGVAAENLSKTMAIVDPERLRTMVADGTLQGKAKAAANHALKKADELRARPRYEFVDDTTGLAFAMGNNTAEDQLRMAREWMDPAEGLAAKEWYPEVKSGLTRLVGEKNADMIIRMFAVSQASDSPVNGLRMVLRALEQSFTEEFVPATQKLSSGEIRAYLRPVMRPGTSLQLNSENIVRAMLNWEIGRNYGAKLNDFTDSIMGNTSRRWTGRDIKGLSPVAVDRHTARDVGFFDDKVISRLAELSSSKHLENGVVEIRDRNNQLVMRVREQKVIKLQDKLDPKTGNVKKVKVETSSWGLVDEAGGWLRAKPNKNQKIGSIKKAADFDGAPQEYQYEHGSKLINDTAARFNEEGLWGRHDWTAADVQAVGWMRIQKTMGGMQESPMDMFTKNTHAIAAEISPEKGSDWEKYATVMGDLTDDQRRRVTRKVNTYMAQRIRDELGLITVAHDWVGSSRWAGGDRTFAGTSFWLATPQSAQDVADVMANVYRQQEVWSTKVIAATRFKRTLHNPMIDITHPLTDHVEDAESNLHALAIELNAPGSSIIKGPDGRLSLRIIDRPAKGEPVFVPRLANGRADEVAWDVKLGAALEESGMEGKTHSVGGKQVPLTFESDASHVEVHVGGPPRSADGTVNWANADQNTLASLASRGRRLQPEALARLRDESTRALESALGDETPERLRGGLRGDPLLYDQRAGHVLGYTERLDDGSSVIAATQRADQLTGLHELGHIFATDLDQSLKQRVMDARKAIINVNRTDLDKRIADLQENLATAKTQKRRLKVSSQLTALQHDMGDMADEEVWGTKHEEFFVDQFHRWLKTGEAPSRMLVPAFEHFRNWLTEIWSTVRGNKQAAEKVSPQMESLFKEMFGAPSIQTANYDIDQQVMKLAATQAFQQGAQEAFTTQYFKPGRSWFERSINHPYLGLYPFSYMYGKVLPEMFRFLALRPFGMTTPLLGWNALREVSDTVRMQQQLDGGFRDWMSQNAQAFQAINILFPAMPSEIPSQVPLAARRVAEQGLENADRAAAGRATLPIDYSKGIADTAQYAFGLAGSIKQGADIVGGVGNTIRQLMGVPQPGAQPAIKVPLNVPLG